jgi:hypothetical protein
MSRPKSAAMPGPSSTAATQGPLFNAPLQTSGYINRTPVNPYKPATNNWYTWGNAAEPQFFNNNQLNLSGMFPTLGTSPALGTNTPAIPMAYGGALSMAANHQYAHGGEPHGHVQGPGTSTSDSIPVRLSSGEYILTAKEISRIGRGSNNAGARILDQARAEGRQKEIPRMLKRRAGAR